MNEWWMGFLYIADPSQIPLQPFLVVYMPRVYPDKWGYPCRAATI